MENRFLRSDSTKLLLSIATYPPLASMYTWHASQPKG
jgi:hypothetical protein